MYSWHWSLEGNVDTITLSEYEPYMLEYSPDNCHRKGRRDIAYCMFILRHPHFNVRLNVKHLSFKGLDYFGDREEEESCSFEGVTLMDERRFQVLADPDLDPRLDVHVNGGTTRAEAIERLLPEVTMCRKIQLHSEGENGPRFEWPLTTFTSTYGGLLILFYGYGGYTNRQQIEIRLEATVTKCVGYMINCAPVTVDGYAFIGEDANSINEGVIQEMKQHMKQTMTHTTDSIILFAWLNHFVNNSVVSSTALFYHTQRVGDHTVTVVPTMQHTDCITLMSLPFHTQTRDQICRLGVVSSAGEHIHTL
jgi:hypothetical protein